MKNDLMHGFGYEQAFARNLGVVTPAEQKRLRECKVAVLGVGGVGGWAAHVLARMGVGNMLLSDRDHFEVANFNRQVGATCSTVGGSKADVIATQLREINPELVIDITGPVGEENIEQTLEGVDLVVDAVDFFSLGARVHIYREARRRNIPVILSAPLGMSSTLTVFTPGGMTFEDYFDIKPGMSRLKMLVAFLIGIGPRSVHRTHMDMRYVNLADGSGPSLCPAVVICAGFLGIEAMRLLLDRPGVRPAPAYLQYDGYGHRLRRGRIPGGNRNPLQRLRRFVAHRQISKLVEGIEAEHHRPLRELAELNT